VTGRVVICLTVKPLDWQSDDKHFATMHFSRVALLGAVDVIRSQPAGGRESLSFTKNQIAGTVHDLNHTVEADAGRVVQRPRQRCARAFSLVACEHTAVLIDSQS
jgi:hypothetical protein